MKFRNVFFDFSVMLVLVLLYRTSEAQEGPISQADRSSTGILLVTHSQSSIVPQCSPGHVKLWEGYSLFSKDMSSTGSCVRKFSTTPFQSFHSDTSLGMYFREAHSFWLTTDLSNRESQIEGEEIIDYISRCAVCEVPTNVIVLHSQTADEPTCPAGWDLLWVGYSFVAFTSGYRDLSPGDLTAGPGSCLQDFRTIPVIECWGNPDMCKQSVGSLSYWLVVKGMDARKRLPYPRSAVSRCSVCSKE